MQMLAVTQDSSQEPTAADDAASAMWMDVQKINPEGRGLFISCPAIALLVQYSS